MQIGVDTPEIVLLVSDNADVSALRSGQQYRLADNMRLQRLVGKVQCECVAIGVHIIQRVDVSALE